MTERPLTAERLLRSLSVTGKLLGFHYTAYMIEQVAVDPARVHLITKRLYPENRTEIRHDGYRRRTRRSYLY